MMDRVEIGKHFHSVPAFKRYLGIPLIYIPLFVTVPFLFLTVIFIRAHLRLIGARHVRKYGSFVPEWVSHRYRYKDQITYRTRVTRFQFRYYRWYWIFNCKLYCPLSVALFVYCAYLVKIVENWWCPFYHDKKVEYADGAIDRSYWHIEDDEYSRLHPDDQMNPIWNEDAEK